MLYQLSYQGSSAGWAESHIQRDVHVYRPCICVLLILLCVLQVLTLCLCVICTVTEEEDNFPSPNNPNANGAAKHAIVVMNQQKPLKPLTTVISQQNQTRVSDSAFGSEYMSSSDTAEDIECPQSPPPGSLPGSFTNFQSGQQTRAVPPLLNSGAAINFIPEKESRADQPDGHVHGKSKTNTATTPVPTSGGEINFKAQQPMLEAAEYSPPSERLFTVGSLQSGISNAETETNELNEQMPSITKVPLPVQSEEELAEKFLSSHIINKLGQIDELEQQNKQLRRQLSVAIEEMEALRQEKDELSERFESYKKTAKEKEEVIKNELKEKEKKLKECKANAEKEKKEMEAKHKEKCAELQREIEGLNKRIDDEERNTEFQTMKLQVELSKKEKLLSDKEIVILTKQNTIEQLEKKILEKENEEIKKENEELKKERDRLRSESLSRSLSSMQMCDLKREKDSDQAQQ